MIHPSDDLETMMAGEDGWSDWIHPLPGYIMGCCDCGLRHELQVAIDAPQDGCPAFNEGEDQDRVVIFRMRRA